MSKKPTDFGAGLNSPVVQKPTPGSPNAGFFPNLAEKISTSAPSTTAQLVQAANDPLLPDEALIPHTTNLKKRTFVRLAQLSFYSHEEQQEIIEAALVEYLDKHKESDMELPPKQLHKLRNLKKLRRV